MRQSRKGRRLMAKGTMQQVSDFSIPLFNACRLEYSALTGVTIIYHTGREKATMDKNSLF